MLPDVQLRELRRVGVHNVRNPKERSDRDDFHAVEVEGSTPEHSATYKNCYGSPPLSIGLDVLQHLRLYFATKEHILYLTAADAGMLAAAREQ